MSTDVHDAEQAALDADDAELELRRISDLYVRVAELRESVRSLAASLREQKRLLKETGWDLQHRLDQAAKKRVAVRDQQTAAALAARRKEAVSGNQ
jgi:hypothetical protein